MKRIIIAGCALLLAAGTSHAQELGHTTTQVDPLPSQYFQNQYLGNPAFAGVDSGLHLNGSYRRQLENAPGVPVTMAFTGDYYVGRRVGAGVNVMLDKAGLLSRSRVTLTYAYHLPLTASGEQKLHFGVSAGFRYDRLDTKAVNADPNDPSLGLFNRRDNYFDGDFGVAYTDAHWNVQAALPNIAGYLKEENRQIANSATFYAAASYKFNLADDATSIEPKVAYRGVRHYDNLFDLGANVTFLKNALNVFGLYHTSKNFTAGAGFNVKETVNLQLMYTSQTAGLRNYLDSNFTLGITINLFRDLY
ncbi:PorP/SprF family type IX secretion system membrane protein [Chitinophaga horti]|uniref:PorP/SprF family type IX secretion system membrane protein n=1 Tax=Chitinophaga horti TaxID=2920382 RepID=A0ABY6J5B3_9BACT|nr:PorP/SprF family type IX secretion system membrane protein [Chitinophaga horti]UYQ94866.1 PorP/SprF family type IX secretion system membrane protein [Chitinophaga horti]